MGPGREQHTAKVLIATGRVRSSLLRAGLPGGRLGRRGHDPEDNPQRRQQPQPDHLQQVFVDPLSSKFFTTPKFYSSPRSSSRSLILHRPANFNRNPLAKIEIARDEPKTSKIVPLRVAFEMEMSGRSIPKRGSTPQLGIGDPSNQPASRCSAVDRVRSSRLGVEELQRWWQ